MEPYLKECKNVSVQHVEAETLSQTSFAKHYGSKGSVIICEKSLIHVHFYGLFEPTAILIGWKHEGDTQWLR